MKRYLIILSLVFAAGILPLLPSQHFFGWTETAAGQARARRQTPRRSAAPAIDYSRFQHATKDHQQTCVRCHKIPTSNWQTASGFPDVADFPGHDACVGCHRQQFFQGARPTICSDCHTAVSPRSSERLGFRNPKAPRQFNLNFPHHKHQDVIASLSRPRKNIETINFVTASLRIPRPQTAERKPYNNCEICHRDNSKALAAPAGGWVDGVKPVAEAFKSQPDSHSYCFSCHWKAQAPVKDQCDLCHKPTSPYMAVESPKRISMKFDHNGGKKQHQDECTTCHVNVTKPAHLKRSKIDVPLLTCKQCHGQGGGAAPMEIDCRALRVTSVIADELQCLEANRQYICTYCHTSDFGRLEPPISHFLVGNKKAFTRKDAK
jgi:hypothetical protein